MKYEACKNEPYKLSGDSNFYKYFDKPKLLLELIRFQWDASEFSIETVWFFYENEKEFKKHQTYDCSIELGDTMETIYTKVNEIVADSLRRLNRKDLKVDLSEYAETIQEFKNSLPLEEGYRGKKNDS